MLGTTIQNAMQEESRIDSTRKSATLVHSADYESMSSTGMHTEADVVTANPSTLILTPLAFTPLLPTATLPTATLPSIPPCGPQFESRGSRRIASSLAPRMLCYCVVGALWLGGLGGCSIMERVSEGVQDLPALLLGQTPIHSDTSGATSPYSPSAAEAPWSKPLSAEALRPEPLLILADIPNHNDYLGVSQTGRVVLIRGAKHYGLVDLGHSPTVAAFSPDRRYLISARENEVFVADLFTGTQQAAVNRRLPGRVTALCAFPGEHGVVMGGADGKIYRWMYLSPSPGENVLSDFDRSFERYLGTASVISALACHPGGRFFLSGSWTGSLTAWLNSDADIYRGDADEKLRPGGLFSEVATKVGSRGSDETSIETVRLSRDGERLYALKRSGVLELWSVRGLKIEAVAKALRGEARDIAVNADGSRIAILARSGVLAVWRLVEGQSRAGAPKKGELEKVGEALVPDGRLVATRDETSALVVLATGETRQIKIEALAAAETSEQGNT